MQARLTNREWATDWTRASALINFMHETDPRAEVIGLRVTIQSLPGPMKLGGTLDLRMTFKETEALAVRILARIGQDKSQGQVT
jgi:hypothetical protein